MLYAILTPGLGIIVLASTPDLWYEPLKASVSYQELIFISAAAVLAGLSMIPTHAASLTAGLLFGSIAGSFHAISAIIIASVISYFLTAKLLGDKLMDFIELNPKASEIHKELFKLSGFRAVFIIILVRLSPVMPFAATNVLLAAAKVRWWQFLVGSILGLAPRIILVVIAGAALSTLDLNQKGHKSLFIITIASTVCIIYFINKLSKNALKKFSSHEQQNQASSEKS